MSPLDKFEAKEPPPLRASPSQLAVSTATHPRAVLPLQVSQAITRTKSEDAPSSTSNFLFEHLTSLGLSQTTLSNSRSGTRGARRLLQTFNDHPQLCTPHTVRLVTVFSAVEAGSRR